MKLSWALLGVMIATPVAAAPARWSSSYTAGIHDYHVGGFGAKATNLTISCPDLGAPRVAVLVGGVLPPSNEEIGFKAAGRALALRTGDNGTIKINTAKDRAAFTSFWSAVRAGSTLDISLINGVSAALSLTGSARALPALPCGR